MTLSLKLLTVVSTETDAILRHFTKKGEAEKVPGFIRHEVSVDRKPDKTTVCILEYWENDELFKQWIGSDAHKETHKEMGDKQNIIEEKKYHFTVEASAV